MAASLLTMATVKAALRDGRAGGREYDATDTQIPGLQIRVSGVGARWSIRCRLNGKLRRYDLGPVCDGSKDSPPALCLDGARSRAFTVREMCRKGLPPGRQLEAWALGVTVEQLETSGSSPPLAPEPAAQVPSWAWEDAITRFVAWNREHRRDATADDYDQKLRQVPEMAVFAARLVNTLTRNELMEAVDRVNRRGRWSTACGCRRSLSRFFNWLAEPSRQNETNVEANLLLNTKDPEKPRSEIGENEADFNPDDEMGDAPPPIELGRALAIARSGVMPERIGLGIQLLFGTVQRRRAVLGASRHRFVRYPDAPLEYAWFVPPYFRKSGSKRGSKSHLVPVVSWAFDAVQRLDRMGVEGGDPVRLVDGAITGKGDNPFLFPAVRVRDDSKHSHADIEMLNRALEWMPGVAFGPHGARYALATYGERELGFAKSEAKVVLDHLEGTDPKDVTGSFYSSDGAVKRKREMLRAWCAWLDEQAAAAIAADPLLRDLDYLREARFKAKYGWEKLAMRIEFRARKGWPLWGPGKHSDDDLREAAE
jgi:integrase